ncbi:PIR Superfamily Protein [Plasmodium ovale curtisi]|uniref:PIR Superfamily Protein n=1 Tax=Plasmodium ovale curtisi TaxID=864141 RepID=A0A1A8WST2_PLAOA|nr:PIR Superfamily Protein [Plasmodium ovale curtisi]SBS99806.1 PIR Superfamily Protein [Plasmodium ovale curtisi]
MTNGIRIGDLPSKKYNNELKNGINYNEIVKNIESDEFSSEDKFSDSYNTLDIILKKIKEKIKTKTLFSYELIALYINNSAQTHLNTWNNECTRNSKINENYDNIENIKNIDDLCEDTAYINGNISGIHRKLKSKCQEDIARSSLTGDQGEMSQYSGRNASIIAVTSLSGILFSFVLLYKITSFGSILNTLIRKKIKFGNNLSDEAYHETLEDISESSHHGTYNILYNSVPDY